MTPEEATAAVSVAERVSRELDEDYVGLWVVFRHLRDSLMAQPAGADFRCLVQVVLTGLATAGARLGDLDANTGVFLPWPSLGATERAIADCAALGRDPNIGEVAWLARDL